MGLERGSGTVLAEDWRDIGRATRTLAVAVFGEWDAALLVLSLYSPSFPRGAGVTSRRKKGRSEASEWLVIGIPRVIVFSVNSQTQLWPVAET